MNVSNFSHRPAFLERALVASALALAAGSVMASSTPELNRWHVFESKTSAVAVIDGRLQNDFHRHIFGDGLLAEDSLARLNADGRSAEAQNTVGAARLGSFSAALQPLAPDATISLAHGYSMISFMAYLSSAAPVTLDLHLSGTLQTLGDRAATGSDPSRAVVAAYGVGSPSDANEGGFDRLFANIGIDPNLEGEALLNQLAHWPTSSQRNLQTLGVQTDSLQRSAEVDQRFSVTADSTRVDCPAGVVSPLCGSYYLQFHLFLFTAAENGGLADFSHSLSVDAIHVAEGTSLSFEPGQALPVITTPVPEPSPAVLLGLGLLAIGGLKSRRGHRKSACD
ncbi:PEP-CTERM sorting domain-containing protein [Paucibacter sp. DJ2R-2]|uniref:PEP-CTERM sorting domain-containing protein n=1 Tax=Paucibacter sp. DJ2R-2 TaxID=2893558 RepID=UPI0021E3D0BD|nr:PEP-CTERM sorting domain-containing protein [Paucibacter sp. DJ2R-2]MCV2418985.1 PEP-CTERM sorting domain-containing protein [Paucibacter sp. DJ4R-1]MCV2438060.1 PEP-CTERM sorting domain-containing protein [Paucibacter sp. DJ2R-2]